MNPPVGVTDPASVASEVYKYRYLHPELVEQLVSIYRTMFPHSTVPDEFYEHVVRKLDDEAAQNQALSGLVMSAVIKPLAISPQYELLHVMPRMPILAPNLMKPFRAS